MQQARWTICWYSAANSFGCPLAKNCQNWKWCKEVAEKMKIATFFASQYGNVSGQRRALIGQTVTSSLGVWWKSRVWTASPGHPHLLAILAGRVQRSEVSRSDHTESVWNIQGICMCPRTCMVSQSHRHLVQVQYWLRSWKLHGKSTAWAERNITKTDLHDSAVWFALFLYHY